jgi:hypothetical protein
MSGGIARVLYDTDPLVSGSQQGSAGVTIRDGQKDFYSCGVRAGLAIQNTKTATFGHVMAVTEDLVVADISFANGDSYEIYCTATYGSSMGRWLEDKRYGHKTDNRANLTDGLFPEDIDVDENQRHVFGPGQPWETKV